MMNSKTFAAALLAAGMTLSGFVTASDMTDPELLERVKPVGSLYLEGDQAVAAAPSGPRSGADVYGSFCVACHAAGVLNAPKLNDAADWEPRLAQGFDTVVQKAIDGFNQMPAKGTCMDCSDDEIKAAIEHMIAEI